MLCGTIESFTIVRNPPKGFGSKPISIALIQLDDQSTVVGQVLGTDLEIGMSVAPRMKHIRTNEEGLRMYDICYTPVKHKEEKVFPGYIIALTGPSGVGKTTVNTLLANALTDRIERVPILTTRKAKPHDTDEYEHVELQEFQHLLSQREIIAATKIPSRSEQRWYGYRASDIERIWQSGKIPAVVTEMHLLQDLAKHYGRRSILSCGLLPPGKSKRTMLSCLLHRLQKRGRDSDESIQDRIKNAEADLQFFEKRDDLFDHIVVNDDVDTVVDFLKPHILQLSEIDVLKHSINE